MSSGPDPREYGWWLASRASGLTALALITLSVMLGLLMAGGVSRRPGLKRALLDLHEQAALGGLVAIAVHGITLMGDRWLHPGPLGVAVPWVIDYRPTWVALGIIGGWLGALLGLSYYWRRQIGAKRWRQLHRLTVVVYVLSVAHTLGAGTDAGTVALRAFMLVTGVPIAVLFARRVLGGRRRPVSARPAGA